MTKCAHLSDRALETYFLPTFSKEMLLDLCGYTAKVDYLIHHKASFYVLPQPEIFNLCSTPPWDTLDYFDVHES